MSHGPRYVFLDVLRGVAVLWMIQVHITNVFLFPELRTGTFFTVLNISNGFVAPAFLFCAGSGLWIALSRKGTDYLQYNAALWGYLKRLAYIVLWAYLLHIPTYSLLGMVALPHDQLIMGLQVDILQTIVYASLLVLAMFLLLRDLHRTAIASAIIAVLISATTVWLWPWITHTLPEPIALMFTLRSPFPLLPWMAYLLMGVFVTGWFMRTQNKRQLALWFVAVGLVLPVVIFGVKGLAFASPWTAHWWQASPPSQLFRICGIVIAFGGLYLIEERLQRSKVGRTLQTMGMESLFLYISHLMLVYNNGPMIAKALFSVDHTGYMGILLIWVFVTLPLVAIAFYWHRLKKTQPQIAQRILVIQVILIVVSFALVPAEFQLSDLWG